VTVVASGFTCIFGKVIYGEIDLNNLGLMAKKYWLQIPDHFPNVEIEPFVIMPNHMHGIITIHENERRGTIYRAPTEEGFGHPISGSIPTIIRTYKASVSRIAKREMGKTDIWQRGYYEHIVRNPLELDEIAKYINSNPQNWAGDPEFFAA
jgi:REP element-mobilizing transposase RayT